MSKVQPKILQEEEVIKPADVLVVVVVYIPHLMGYFTNRLSVLRLCLESLLKHTPKEAEFLIFDNGSCAETETFLIDLVRRGDIRYLYRCHFNIGKLATMRLIFQLSPRAVVAFSDDDIFFYPGWLESQLDIFNAFPNVGMVSGVPTLDGAGFALESTLANARRDPSITMIEEAYIPANWEADWAASTGRDPVKRAIEARTVMVTKLVRNDVEAFVGATHFQFSAFASRIASCLPGEWPVNLMGGMRELDTQIDVNGFMRLSTAERRVRHMGNYVQRDVRKEVQQMGLSVTPSVAPPRLTAIERLPMKSGRVRNWGRKLYRRLGLFIDGQNIINIPWKRNVSKHSDKAP